MRADVLLKKPIRLECMITDNAKLISTEPLKDGDRTESAKYISEGIPDSDNPRPWPLNQKSLLFWLNG